MRSRIRVLHSGSQLVRQTMCLMLLQACCCVPVSAGFTLAERVGPYLERQPAGATVWVTTWVDPQSSQNDGLSARLEWIREFVIVDLSDCHSDLAIDADVDAFVAESCRRRHPGPKEARLLESIEPADLLLAISYGEYRRRPTVLFSLASSRRTLWTERVFLRHESQLPSEMSHVATCRRAGRCPMFRTMTVPSSPAQFDTALASLTDDNAGSESIAVLAIPADVEPVDVVDSASLREAVLQFAFDHFGRQVGDGECYALCAGALRAVGARSPEGYEFGEPLPIESVGPGDILHFLNIQLRGAGYWMQLGTPHHAAIVVARNDSRITILHQNFNRVRTVQFGEINLADLQSGRIRAYEPVSP